MGAFGTLLGASWALFGRLLDALGCLLGISWGSWVHFGPSGLDWGSILEGFERIWEGLGVPVGSIWAPFGA